MTKERFFSELAPSGSETQQMQNKRSGGILQKTQKRVWCQRRCQWQPLLSVCGAFCFPWHLSNTKWRSGFDDNEIARPRFGFFLSPPPSPRLSVSATDPKRHGGHSCAVSRYTDRWGGDGSWWRCRSQNQKEEIHIYHQNLKEKLTKIYFKLKKGRFFLSGLESDVTFWT